MIKKYTIQNFIARSHEIHGEQYDYSKFVYTGNKNSGIIICSEHGEFKKTPVAHVNKKRGCPHCIDGYFHKKTTKSFIAEAKLVHGKRYDYSLVEYDGAFGKVVLVCPEHGKFLQTAREHLNGKGCSRCKGGVAHTIDDFISKSKLIHSDRYDYSNVVYQNKNTPVIIICEEHGEFEQRPGVHVLGGGCPDCADNKRVSVEDWVIRCRVVHGEKYDYSKVDLHNLTSPVTIVCNVHGEFEQTPAIHQNGHGCSACANDSISKKLTKDFQWFVKKAKAIHRNEYSYREDSYTNTNGKVTVVCSKHGKFSQRVDGHLYQGIGCPSCACIRSKAETEIFDFLSYVHPNVERNNRAIIFPFELDIVVPDRRLAIEYCGLRWHSEHFGKKSRDYHLNKFEMAKAAGYRLITIFEDEWVMKNHIVKSILRGALGLEEQGISARKTTVLPISWKDTKEFLDKYHLQGSGAPMKIRYGAYHCDELIAVMTFSSGRAAVASTKKEIMELVRFATSGKRHPGLASKMFTRFMRDYNPKHVISYSDNRWFTGSMYSKLGFANDGTTKPSYWYLKNPELTRYHRYNFRKQKVLELGGDPNKSEWQNMKDFGYDRIWDCGTVRWMAKAL